MSGGDIRIAFKSTGEDSQLRLVAQMGASDVVLDLPKEMHGRVWKEEQLCGLKERAESFGLRLSVLEGYGPPPSNRIRMGLPGRDEDVEKYCDSIRNMGAVGIPILCYNWIPVYNWMRTAFDVPTRGGALVTAYDHREKMKEPMTEYGEVGEEQLWEALEYFFEGGRTGGRGGGGEAGDAPFRSAALTDPRTGPDHDLPGALSAADRTVSKPC